MKKRVLCGAGLAMVALGLVFGLQAHNAHLQEVAVAYRVPDVELVDQQGRAVALRSYLNAELPVMLMFGFTSCTTLCPEQSVLFANLQHHLEDSRQVRLVTITVDPETDRPEVLRDYLEKFGAQPGWDFLTGSKRDIKRVMEAFDYRPADMVTLRSALLIHPARGPEWIRVDGDLNGKQLQEWCQQLVRRSEHS